MPGKWASAPILVYLLVSTCWGCVGDGNGSTDAQSDTAQDQGPECTPEPGAGVDLSGWWAVRVYVMLEMIEDPGATIHVCNDPPMSLATVTWLLDAGEPSGEEIGYTFQTCALTLPEVEASFADCTLDETLTAFLLTTDTLDASLPLVQGTGTMRVPGLERCSDLESDDLYVRIGVDPGFPDGIPLPGWDPGCTGSTAEECVAGYSENVQDTDSDGFPGGTFQILTDPVGLVEGFARATLRHSPNLRGTVRSDVLVDGDLLPTLEYDLVGSDAAMAGLDIDTPTVKKNLPTFVPVAGGSQFVMVRVDGAHGSPDLGGGDGMVDCAELLASPWVFD